MPIFVTLVLGAAGLLTVGLLVPVFLAPPAQGYNGIGALLLMLVATGMRWALIAGLLGWCVGKGRFDWLPSGSIAGRIAIVIGIHVVLGGLSAISMLAASDASMLRGLPHGLIGSIHVAAQIGCTLPAIAVIACLAAINRRGPATLPTVPLLGVVASALAGLVVVGALVGQDIRSEQHRAVLEAEATSARVAQIRQRFAALTDADPLLAWVEFVHADVPADLAAEALRRLSIRPTLERDLANALGCDCRNPNWTAELVWLIGAIPFEPSSDLAGPVQKAIVALAAQIRDSAEGANGDQRDTYVDLYLARELDVVRFVATKFARSATSDLRPALEDVRRAVVETYPRSQAARRYPAEVDRTMGEIAAMLPAR